MNNDRELAIAFITATMDFSGDELKDFGPKDTMMVALPSILGFAVEHPGAAKEAVLLLEQFTAEQTGLTPEQVEVRTRGLLRSDTFKESPS